MRFRKIDIKQNISKLKNWLKQPNVIKIGIISGSATLAVSALALGIAVLTPKHVQMSFQKETCLDSQLLLRGSNEEEFEGFLVRVDDSQSGVGARLCVQPKSKPVPGEFEVTVPILGLSFLRQTALLIVPELPKPRMEVQTKVPLSKPLKVELTKPDSLNTYHIKVGDQTQSCKPSTSQLLCDIKKLDLKQGQAYDIALTRSFNGKNSTEVLRRQIEVLESVKLVDSSVKPGDTVYGKPAELALSFDKPLQKHDVKLVAVKDDVETEIRTLSATKEDTNVVLSFNPEEVPRQAAIQVVATEFEAKDGSTVDSASLLEFQTSGGPVVESVSIGSSNVAAGSQVVVQLDQEADPNQDIANLVKLTGIAGSVKLSGDKILVQLDSGAARCAPFSISIQKGMVNPHGIVNDSEWGHQSRIRCHDIRTIGSSVQGRPINAYYFGNGNQTVLFTGAIHGNELSSKYIMDNWIAELEARSGDIPGDKQIVVVPTVSPDSVAAAKRFNANNVNLNRNFPTRNWVSDTPVSGGRIEHGAGGKSALSEPEASALARLTLQLNPRLVVTYHSLGSLVNGNDVGIANTLGPLYARMARYSYIPNSATAATFGFDMTGTYEDWLAERGTPAILIELNTNTGNHFTQNRPAMWEMVRG